MIFFVGLLCAVALAQPTTAPFTTLGATNAPSPVASAWQTTTTSTVRSRSPSTTAPFPSAPWPTESCSQPPSSIYSPCTSSDDRVRWASEATRTPLTQHTTSTSSLLLIGTVKSVVSAAGQSFQRVMFDDLWSVERGVVARETRPVFAYACSYYSYARNFNTSANIAAQFPVGRKLLLFAFSEFSFNGTANLIVSPCADETTGACLDATNPQCPSGLMRQLLLVAASANADLGRLLSIDSATMCSPTCKNGGQCKLGICACPLNFMGTTCEIARPPPPAVTVTTTRIVPGAGSNGSDIWISGTTRKIQIPILSADRTIPTGFARVMLLNLNPAAWCRMRLPNATLDGLPTWYFADSSEVDPTTSPRFLVTELLAVVDLSKLKWVAGTKAKSTIVVEHTLTLAESCKDAGSGYRVAVMLSANRNDDAALAGPYTGGQFTIGIGGCIGDGVAGMCMSNLGASTNFGVGANVCTLSSSPLKIAAKTVTAGQCTGADTVCCIPDRTNLVAAPISPYAFLAFDLPKSQATVQGPPISAYTWGETVKLTWTTNRLRPQPSPFSLFFPDGFCAIDEGLDTASASFELLLVAANNMMSPTGANTTIASLGKVKLSLGKFDAPLQQPQNFYTPYQVQFVAKFSETCKYTSLPFQVRESPCFSSATKTLIGTCRAVCNTWGDDTNAIGTCAGLTHASKCCGRIRNSNDGFRFADEGVEGEVPADETGATASSMSLAAVAVATTMMAQMLNLNGTNLHGPIPSAIGTLTALTYLNLANNNITGSIPSAIGQLTALKFLFLQRNQLTGPIPSNLLQNFTQCLLRDGADTSETNCLNCSTNRTSSCTCDGLACFASQPTSIPTPMSSSSATTTTTTTTTQTPSSSTSMTSLTSSTSLESSSQSTQQSSSTPSSATSSATQTERSTSTNATVGVVIPPTDAPDDNAALIGGIVGGIVALILIGGLIAFLVVVRSRNLNHDNNSNAMTSTTPTPSNYNRIPTKNTNYNDRIGVAVDASSGKHYDALASNEL